MILDTTPAPSSEPPIIDTPSRVLGEASAQWWRRPDDERYLSLEDLLAATTARAAASQAADFDRVAVRCLVPNDRGVKGAPLRIETPYTWGDSDVSELALTDWTLGQLCGQAKVDVRTVRRFGESVPGGTGLMAFALNLGLQHLTPNNDGTQLYVRTDGESGALMSINGTGYGRIYDKDVVAAIMAATEGGEWKVPSASYQAKNPKRATTLYASDRDVFIFLVDESRPIVVRTPDGVRTLNRGFFAWNSEVGKTSFGITTFGYDYVCDNRNVWGAHVFGELRIRHTSGAPERFAIEGKKAIEEYAGASVRKIEKRLEAAARFKVGNTEEDVLDFLAKRGGYSKGTGAKIIEMAKAEEGGAETAWQLLNGATALARGIAHTDARIEAERRASKLLLAVPEV